jgi:ATP-dependent Clp protease adaptor protein ClpS
MSLQESSIKERKRVEVKKPRRYQVIFHNDDVTTMDFVVFVLQRVFYHPKAEAMALMLKVHRTGQAVVGTYSYDMARTKTEKALKMARDHQYPLSITYQPE